MLSKFKVNIIAHLVGIILAVFTGVYIYINQSNYLLTLIIVGILIGLLTSLFALINATNKKLADFLMNIKYDDFEAHYSSVKGEEAQEELTSAFNLITGKFRTIRQEKEAQYQYLHAIVENVDTGLICFDDNDKTILMNKGLQQLLRKSYFRDMESINKYNAALHDAIREVLPGEQKLVKLVVNSRILQLSLRKTILKFSDEALHLYAIQNIHAELEQQEVESWQKLIRILTHEILNSITPVVSLAGMANEIIQTKEVLDSDEKDDIKKSIEAIERRSNGLLHFTETYRQLTKIPVPKFQTADPTVLMESVLMLFSKAIKDRSVEIITHFPANPIQAVIDPNLIEQVFINLIKNALEAMEDVEKPTITIAIAKDLTGTIEISVADNGPGIPEELQSEIFVPFFTTKEEGSGIGLSLSRQIIQLHKGTMFVSSEPHQGTRFIIQI